MIRVNRFDRRAAFNPPENGSGVSVARLRERDLPLTSLMPTRRPFDAVLVISFGGPRGMADVRPFLANVLRGRRIPPERIEEVAGHYEHFGGVSPLTEITLKQADGLQQRLASAGFDIPVFVGMRNWHPLLPDTLKDMANAGV